MDFTPHTAKNGMDRFWDKRLVKVMMPAFFAQATWFVIVSCVEFVKSRNISTNYLLLFSNLICVNSENDIDPSIWYMSFLLFCYICFYLVFALIKNRRVAVVVLCTFWIAAMPIMVLMWPCCFYCVFAFPVGVLLAIEAERISIVVSTKILKIILILLFFSITIWYYFNFRQNRIVDNIVSILFAFGIMLLTSLVKCNKSKKLSFIGKHSFSIYLFQGKIIFGWFPYSNYASKTRLAVFLILSAVNICIAVLFDLLIPKIVKKIMADTY